MVDVRCRNFDNILWTYVVEYARIRKISRCKALEQVVLEHMKFIYDEHKAQLDDQRGASAQEWVNDLISLGIGASASNFLLKRLSSDGGSEERIEICQHCGRQIRKWAIKCPYCRSNLQNFAFS